MVRTAHTVLVRIRFTSGSARPRCPGAGLPRVSAFRAEDCSLARLTIPSIMDISTSSSNHRTTVPDITGKDYRTRANHEQQTKEDRESPPTR